MKKSISNSKTTQAENFPYEKSQHKRKKIVLFKMIKNLSENDLRKARRKVKENKNCKLQKAFHFILEQFSLLETFLLQIKKTQMC